MAGYDHKPIEAKWQQRWEAARPGRVSEDAARAQDALYYLVMFPYPSAAGLHVGHVESFAAVDILARWQRMQGKHVLFPIGYDAFGLPAENYAVKTGVHPAETTNAAIVNFRRQMKALGLSFDWDREISTCDPSYYKWTQWLFLQLYKQGLAYKKKAAVNWCEKDQTVLANEQVVNGACERCGTPVIQKELSQWFFGITKYADRLLDGLDELDWPEKIKAMQRNWIGKSEGAEIAFGLPEGKDIRVFTTRPDTLMGVSYVVLSPEHALVDALTVPEKKEEMDAYRVAARGKSELERTQLEKDKSGVFTGSFATHPITGEPVQVWVSDYVLTTYGTGAVMGVPAHDERDFAFAKKYGLAVKQVISGGNVDEAAHTEGGALVNSGPFDGLDNETAKKKIVEALEKEGKGAAVTKYRLRDWLVSRQRYWGAPIPVVYDPEGNPHAVKEEHLPLVLPTDVDYLPKGTSPIGSSKSYIELAEKLYGPGWRFETDTMDTFVDSSWYYLRYCDPTNNAAFADRAKLDYWCPVDLCVGGAEHAVLHLLYVRFFAKFLHEQGLLGVDEPFAGLRNQGMILGPDGEKMSKSKGNVINPDDVVAEHGADALRLYEMFMGPLEDMKPWDTKGIVGVRRFLDKVVKLADRVVDGENNASLSRATHKALKAVTADIPALRFNTAIAQMMTAANALQGSERVPREVFSLFVRMLAPFAPHLGEELWARLGNAESVFAAGWPAYDDALATDDAAQIAVQVNGKLRGTISLDLKIDSAAAKEAAAAEPNVAKHLVGKKVLKVVYVPGRLVNFVVKD